MPKISFSGINLKSLGSPVAKKPIDLDLAALLKKVKSDEVSLSGKKKRGCRYYP